MQSELDHMKIEDVSAKILSVLLSLVKETNISHSQHAIMISLVFLARARSHCTV